MLGMVFNIRILCITLQVPWLSSWELFLALQAEIQALLPLEYVPIQYDFF